MNKNAIVGFVVAALGAVVMAGCATETSTEEGTDPVKEEVASPKEATPPAPAPAPVAAVVAEGTASVETKSGGCYGKPGVIRCSCGICAYESSCRSVCSGL